MTVRSAEPLSAGNAGPRARSGRAGHHRELRDIGRAQSRRRAQSARCGTIRGGSHGRRRLETRASCPRADRFRTPAGAACPECAATSGTSHAHHRAKPTTRGPRHRGLAAHTARWIASSASAAAGSKGGHSSALRIRRQPAGVSGPPSPVAATIVWDSRRRSPPSPVRSASSDLRKVMGFVSLPSLPSQHQGLAARRTPASSRLKFVAVWAAKAPPATVRHSASIRVSDRIGQTLANVGQRAAPGSVAAAISASAVQLHSGLCPTTIQPLRVGVDAARMVCSNCDGSAP